MIHFLCQSCGYDQGQTIQRESNDYAKMGRPCPRCNQTRKKEKNT